MNGKTFIGQLVEKQSQLPPAVAASLSETVYGSSVVVPSSEYVIIYAPALVEFTLGKTSDTTGKLVWSVTPLMFGALIENDNDANFWMFERSSLSFSALREGNIKGELISAYEQVI